MLFIVSLDVVPPPGLLEDDEPILYRRFMRFDAFPGKGDFIAHRGEMSELHIEEVNLRSRDRASGSIYCSPIRCYEEDDFNWIVNTLEKHMGFRDDLHFSDAIKERR